MIEKYSWRWFLPGVADAFLFAVKQGKSLAIAVDPQSDRALEVLSARDYLCGILPENIQIERREGDDLDTKKDQRIGADFIRETQGHQNAYYILMSVFCYARQNDERSYCMNLCKNATLIMSSVSFVAAFEPCFGQHLKNWEGHFRVPKWQKMFPQHSPLKNHTRLAFIENATPCKQAKLIL